MHRRLIFLFALIFCGLSGFGQAHVVVDSATHNFGTVKQGANPTHTFVLKNTGNSPLIINSVDPSCGCIVATYTREPIPPGKTGTIVLIFSSESKRGFQLRSTTVSTNADNPELVLYMKGTIVKRR